VLTQNLGEMGSIYCVHKNKKKSIAFIYLIIVDRESKKESIAFIYIFVLTQNFGEMGGINYLIYVHRKEKEIYCLYLYICVDTESWRDGGY